MKKNYSLDTVDSNLLYIEEFRDKPVQEKEVTPPPEKEEFKIVGKYTPRIDGKKIVTGAAGYTQDIQLKGMLWGKILRCPYACAEVVSIDLSQAEKMPGVKAAVELKEGKIKFAGDQVAAVAAVDEKTALDALAQIKVEYKELPHVVTVEKAMEKDAPQVHNEPNVSLFNEYSRGDIEKGFQEAELILERTYNTAIEIHHPAETHCSVARWVGDRLEVWDSTQAIFGVRDGLARILEMPAGKVRVIKKYMGGGFGSKLGLNDHTVAAALLAGKTGRPVKIALSRKENAVCVGNRPSSWQTIKGGVKKDGTLTALYLKNYTSGGVGRGDRCAEPIIDVYKCPHLKVEEFTVYTNTGASRPTRAPGHVQGTFALEGFLEELAAEAGIDPLQLRMKNYSTKNEGDTGIPYSTKGLDQCYKLGAEKIGWNRRNKNPGEGQGKIKRGLGMASQIWWGVGRPGTLADLKLHPDGSVEVVCGTQDLGTGTRTYMATIAADTLGLKPNEITVKIGNTDYPWCGASGGSTTTPSVAPAVRDAALQALEFLKKAAAQKMEVEPDKIMAEGDKFFSVPEPSRFVSFKELTGELRREKVFHGEYGGRPSEYAYNTFGAHFAEVEADTETGRIKVLKVAAAHEIGRVINRQTAESQVIGGVIQGVSTALFEQRIMDEATGNLVNPNLSDYKIVTSRDVPDIDIIFVDMVDSRINIMGNKGLGEPPRIPASAAVANAVFNAIGIHPGEIPMTQDKVLAALKRKETGQ
ncbi:MAG: xanthine dehydrogenase family protein molybdopterin-binding subunit [Acidobacteriota bacterium]